MPASAFYFPSFFQAVRGYSEAEATQVVGMAYGVGVFGYIAPRWSASMC